MTREYQIEKVVMLLRHGVRSGFHPERNEEYSGKPWPTFGYPNGQLTKHGRDALVLWGAYHRSLLNRAGLFAEDQALSAADVHVETSPTKRTRESADAFLSGLSPGFVVPSASTDATRWFLPYRVNQVILDPVKGRAAALEALGMSLSAAQVRYRQALLNVERALSIKKGRLADQPWSVEAKESIHLQPLALVEDLLETVRMQYVNGMPIEDVAFGNVPNAEALTALMRIRTLYWQVVHHSHYPAVHLFAPLFAALSGSLLDDSAAAPGLSENTESTARLSRPKLAVYVGHDSNIGPIGAILGFNWEMPGGMSNDQQPGGFIMFERLREVRTGERFVRVSYHAQTLDQLRYLSTLCATSACTPSGVSRDPMLRSDPPSVPFRQDFTAPAAWGARADHLIPIARYQAMVQGVAAEARDVARP